MNVTIDFLMSVVDKLIEMNKYNDKVADYEDDEYEY